MFIELHRDLRGYPFLADDAASYPALYSTEDISAANKLVVTRYFIGDAQWWITEFSAAENLFFGFAYLGQDERDAVARDTDWTPRPASEAIPVNFQAEWWSK